MVSDKLGAIHIAAWPHLLGGVLGKPSRERSLTSSSRLVSRTRLRPPTRRRYCTGSVRNNYQTSTGQLRNNYSSASEKHQSPADLSARRLSFIVSSNIGSSRSLRMTIVPKMSIGL